MSDILIGIGALVFAILCILVFYLFTAVEEVRAQEKATRDLALHLHGRIKNLEGVE